MKKLLSVLVVALVATFTAIAAAPQITVHAVRAAYPGSPNFDAAMANIIQDVRFGRLEHLDPGVLPATPTNYTTYLPGDKLTWQAITSTTNVPSYNGSLNPPEQFAQERGWCITTIVDAKSADGGNSINLQGLRLTINSGDPINTLGYTPSFQGESYYSQAIGIKADGSVLDFYEPGDTMVARIIVRVTGPMYTGETTSAIAGIANYVLGIEGGNFTYTAEAMLDGGTGKVVLETNPTIVIPPTPAVVSIKLGPDPDTITVSTTKAGVLQQRTTFSQDWEDVTLIDPEVPTILVQGVQQFFRVMTP